MYSKTDNQSDNTPRSNPEACSVARELYQIALTISANPQTAEDYSSMASRVVALGETLASVAHHGEKQRLES